MDSSRHTRSPVDARTLREAADQLRSRGLRAARGLLDEAIDLLAHRSVRLDDAEARDLFSSADAWDTRSDPPTLRPRVLRDAIAAAPCAFDLFDRAGRKAATLAAGFRRRRLPVFATAVLAAPGGSGDPRAPGRLPPAGTIAELERLPHLQILGQAPALAGVAPEIAEIYRLYAGLRFSARPQIARLSEAESLDCVRNLLRVLRRGRAAAEERPLLLLEAVGREPLAWDRTACRILIDAARSSIPVAVVLPLPAEAAVGSGGAEAAVTAIAGGLVAIAMHQFARRGAPLLWGLPLCDLGTCSPGLRATWRRLQAAGAALEIPVLATRLGERPAGLAAAAQAACAGCELIAFAGLDAHGRFSIERAREDAGWIPELDALRGLAAEVEIPPGEIASRTVPPAGTAAHPVLHVDLATGLGAVVRREAARRGVPTPPLEEAED